MDSHIPSFNPIIFCGAIICDTGTNVTISVTALLVPLVIILYVVSYFTTYKVSPQAGFHPSKDDP